MMMRKTEIGAFSIAALAFLLGLYFYPKVPENYAFHWNLAGEVDGYIPKVLGLFLMPILMAIVVVILSLAPKFDRFPENVRVFRRYYDGFIIVFCLFFLSIQAWSIGWNLGIKISSNIIFPVLFGILWFYLGILLEKTKRNSFCGIRTPWTMGSDDVWNKTNRLGGQLFKVASFISFLGVLFQRIGIIFILIPVILLVIYTSIYSYQEYRKETEGN